MNQLRNALPGLREQFSVDSLSLFGSCARNEHGPESDIDLLVTFTRVPNFWEFYELREELAALLGARVDLVFRSGLKKHVRERALREELRV
ncbi:nucleotidyltransferase family protein [Candidatus Poribacteria bacterium]|nr:nucleotidyltransferase family protein [Candidatus Poribacteria bacterium]